MRYAIDPGIDLVITDTVVYVGWKQMTDEFLNQGYDVNRNSLDKTFVNTTGDWFNPTMGGITGTIMMRAVFGGKDVISSTPELPVDPSGVIVYPNPVSDILFLEVTGIEPQQIAVYDLFGRLVMQAEENTRMFDLSGFSPGIYQMVMQTYDRQTIVRKIVVCR